MIKLYMLTLEQNPGNEVSGCLMRLISPEKAKKIARISSADKKKQRLYSELFARAVIGRHLEITNEEISFEFSDMGKPFLAGYPDFHFNISHTGGAVLLGISDAPVGVDIERIRPVHAKIARRFFAPAEREYVGEGNGYSRRFFEIWTAKEAFLKKEGLGISVPLSSFDVTSKDIDGLFSRFEWEDYIICCCAAEAAEFPCVISEREFMELYLEQLI